MIFKGYKVVIYDQDDKSYASYTYSRGFVHYKIGEWTYPKHNCGPLCLFPTYIDCMCLVSQEYQRHYHIFECQYEKSDQDTIYDGFVTFHKRDLPRNTVLANKIKLTKQVESNGSIFNKKDICRSCHMCCNNNDIYLSDSEKHLFEDMKFSENCPKFSTECKLYKARPTQCKMFPLDLRRNENGTICWILWYCPISSLIDTSREIDKFEKSLPAGFYESYVNHHSIEKQYEFDYQLIRPVMIS